MSLTNNVNRQLYWSDLNKPVNLFDKMFRNIYRTNLRVYFISTICSSRGWNNRCNQYDCSHTLFFSYLNSILTKSGVGPGVTPKFSRGYIPAFSNFIQAQNKNVLNIEKYMKFFNHEFVMWRDWLELKCRKVIMERHELWQSIIHYIMGHSFN